MNSIQTENLNISAEICKNLDKAVFGGSANQYITEKHALYVSELKTKIASLRPEFKIDSESAYNLYNWCERFLLEDSKHINERMHANMQTAHNQLKNWN